MRKFISVISGALMMFALSAPLATVAKSAEFFSIGTGGPTGVYFQVGNAICKMVAKFSLQNTVEKEVLPKLTVVQHHQQEDQLTISVRLWKVNFNSV